MTVISARLGQKIKKVIANNFTEQTAWLGMLVRTRSSNPYTPDESTSKLAVETQVGELIYQRLAKWGLKPQKTGASQARPNIVAQWGGSRARKSLLLNGHMDTVQPAEKAGAVAWSGSVRGGKLYGVGALDMKGPIAAYMYAVKALRDIGVKIEGRLTLELVVDEEPGAVSRWGTAYLLNKGVLAKAAVIAEPAADGDKIGIGHRGGYRFKLITRGEGVHTGVRAWEKQEKGKNAIRDMARVIEALQKMEIPFKPARAFPGRQPVFTFPTKISGGTAINIVPETCTAYGDVRLMPGNSDTQVKLWMREKLAHLGVDYEVEDLLFVPSVEIDSKEEIVQVLAEEVEAAMRVKPRLEGIGPWNDAWMLIKKDIPTVCQMPLRGGGAHSSEEWVDLASLRQLTEVLARTIVRFLGVIKS